MSVWEEINDVNSEALEAVDNLVSTLLMLNIYYQISTRHLAEVAIAAADLQHRVWPAESGRLTVVCSYITQYDPSYVMMRGCLLY